MTGQVGRFRMRRVALAWLTCGMLGGLVAFAALPASASIRIGIIATKPALPISTRRTRCCSKASTR